MKRAAFTFLLSVFLLTFFTASCFASGDEVTATVGGEATVVDGEREAIIREVIEALLDGGDGIFEGNSRWEVCAAWVRSNLGEIIAGIAGIITLAGSLLILFKTNPKFGKSIDQFKSVCGGWFKTISDGFSSVKASCSDIRDTADETSREVKALKAALLTLIDSYEDVIKLSGADEGKKEIYIGKIEAAKAELKDEE